MILLKINSQKSGWIFQSSVLPVFLMMPLMAVKALLTILDMSMVSNLSKVATGQGGAYSTKYVIQTCTGCFCVPFDLLFEKTLEFSKIGVFLRCQYSLLISIFIVPPPEQRHVLCRRVGGAHCGQKLSVESTLPRHFIRSQPPSHHNSNKVHLHPHTMSVNEHFAQQIVFVDRSKL